MRDIHLIGKLKLGQPFVYSQLSDRIRKGIAHRQNTPVCLIEGTAVSPSLCVGKAAQDNRGLCAMLLLFLYGKV